MRNLYKVWSDRDRTAIQGDTRNVLVSAPDEEMAKQIAYEQYFKVADKNYMRVELVDINTKVVIAIETY